MSDNLLTKTTQTIIRFRVENFGESIDELAHEYGITPALLRSTAEVECWKPGNVAAVAPPSTPPTSLEGLADNLLDDTRNQLTLLTIMAQRMLNPKYLEAEVAILDKLIKVAGELKVNADNAGTQVKSLVGALKDLQERRAVLNATGQNDKDHERDSGKVYVNIIQQFNSDGAPHTTATVDA